LIMSDHDHDHDSGNGSRVSAHLSAHLSAQFHDRDLSGMAPAELDGINDATWLDVIHKMDEVYARLVADETALEEKNAELEQTQQFIFSVLSAMSDVLIACNAQGGIEQTNDALCQLVQLPAATLRGMPIDELLADADSVAK
ncbi:PAS domain-containing protein, partial [Staphylococcus gallinarum]|uniref:PAS domain-containing protein n=1 Tax=Staphylococcus gallinarum TaxID=1293 RepID=UPI00316EE34E